MSQLIPAKFGVLEQRIVHAATDEEIQMIKRLIQDISQLQLESKNGFRLAIAMAFLSAGFSSFLTLLALSGDSPYYYFVASLIFFTSCLGGYSFWDWRVNKKKERSIISQKQEQLDSIFQTIESRIPPETLSSNESEEYEKLIVEDQLELRQLK